MKLLGFLLIALSALLPTAAQAQITWDVTGVFNDGGTLTGSFSLDSYGFLDNLDLVTSTTGTFPGYTYTLASGPASNGVNSVISQPGPYTQALYLNFNDSITTPRPINLLNSSTYECVGSFACSGGTGGAPLVRTLAFGSAHPAGIGLGPEPATWILLIAGFGVTGWLLRRRQRFGQGHFGQGQFGHGRIDEAPPRPA
jgi:hypothetical protein